MTKNPFLNSGLAFLYITIVVLIIFLGGRYLGPEDNFLMPIAFLSLFTLSAAMMGYIFLSQPLQLYLDGKKNEGVKLFVQTLLSFAGITLVVFLLLFFISGGESNRIEQF